MPDRPNFHQVRRAAAQNERSEHPENPVEREILATTYQIDESERDAIVGQRDDAV